MDSEETGMELSYAKYSENVQEGEGEVELAEKTVSITLGRESDNEDELDRKNQNGGLRALEHGVPDKRFTGLSFHDVSYGVMQKKLCRKLPNKTILHSLRCVRLATGYLLCGGRNFVIVIMNYHICMYMLCWL